MKFSRLVIYLALGVSFVSGKINVTIYINVVMLHRLLDVVFRILTLGLLNYILITRNLVTVLKTLSIFIQLTNELLFQSSNAHTLISENVHVLKIPMKIYSDFT